MKRLSSSKRVVSNEVKGDIEWELRPGGMLVQKRNMADAASAPMIKIKVSHGSYHRDIVVPAQSTFGNRFNIFFLPDAYLWDLKRVLAQETGLEPKEQRLLFQGKEKDDEECLHMVGVKDMSKVVLLEDPASKERKLVEMNSNQSVLKACEEVAKVRSEVDKLSEKVIAVEANVRTGTKVAENEFLLLTELLMVQLLQLDTIEADGEAKVQRRVELGSFCWLRGDCLLSTCCKSSNLATVRFKVAYQQNVAGKKEVECAVLSTVVLILEVVELKKENPFCLEIEKVRRVQGLVDTLDHLKARNSNPFSSSCNAVPMSTKWEAFELSSTRITQDWEVFD
ncbi:BAG family molecular chaperone regulator 4 [Gossypium australe]|uniref:BAG family molecular chaperone regulator 4 n=1 Tax=Gossypium australe TaxID=47621 RepID=A0A5B6X5L9_9ROSI|nr:BAG family molecular chaperone regulator 4 [Gossypium australe]